MGEDKKFAFAREKHNELLEMINALEQRVKGVEQQLAEILNLGPTVTQKKMWLDELIGKPFTEEQNKEMLERLKKLR